jgi:hypothetical protein
VQIETLNQARDRAYTNFAQAVFRFSCHFWLRKAIDKLSVHQVAHNISAHNLFIFGVQLSTFKFQHHTINRPEMAEMPSRRELG